MKPFKAVPQYAGIIIIGILTDETVQSYHIVWEMILFGYGPMKPINVVPKYAEVDAVGILTNETIKCSIAVCGD